MATVKEIKTFIAGEDLAAHRRVKVMTASPATTTDPPCIVTGKQIGRAHV